MVKSNNRLELIVFWDCHDFVVGYVLVAVFFSGFYKAHTLGILFHPAVKVY